MSLSLNALVYTTPPLLGGGGGDFSPLSLPSLKLWLKDTGYFDATVGGNPVTGDGAAIARWEDQSGSGNHVIQATGTKQPTLQTAEKNGLSVVRFDGGDGLQSADFTNLAQPSTLFMVAVRTTVGYAFDGQSIARFRMRPNSVVWDIYAGGFISVAYDTTTWGVATGIFNGASSVVRANGVAGSTGNAGTNGLTKFTIGSDAGVASNFLTGDIAEVLFYNALLTTPEIVQVETYLSERWGISF